MESPAGAATTGSSPPTFSQVVFIDIPHSYPPSASVTCCYTLVPTLQPNPRDWVGIFKVGWSSTKDYHTFVWVEPCLDVVGQQSAMRQAVFKDYYLPKDEIEFYQFCYIDSTGQVRGASTPFCFRNPAEQSIESNPDDDLLVITTQEQVEQSVRERAELQRELDQTVEENKTLKRALQKKEQEVAGWKGQNEEKEKEKSELVKEVDQLREEKEKLTSTLQQQQQESDRLKEELLNQKAKEMEMQPRSAAEERKASRSLSLDGASKQDEKHAEEKYNRAVMKINQLKQERDELRGKVEAQCVEISTQTSKIREQQRELLKMKDSIQLMEVDLQSSEKDKERLAAELQNMQSLTLNMDDVKTENQELCRQLSQLSTLQNSSDEDLKVRCQTLCSQLQDAQAKLAAEREESKTARKRVEFLDVERLQVREQLDKLMLSFDNVQHKSNKFELQLREAHAVIAERDSVLAEKEHVIMLLSQEKEGLARENQSLTGELEEQRRVFANLQAATETLHVQPDATVPTGNSSSAYEIPDQEGVYENIDDAAAEGGEQPLVCRHCQERFPLITRQELEQHEQSHRVCPFCTMICDHMEQSVFEDHVYGHEL